MRILKFDKEAYPGVILSPRTGSKNFGLGYIALDAYDVPMYKL